MIVYEMEDTIVMPRSFAVRLHVGACKTFWFVVALLR